MKTHHIIFIFIFCIIIFPAQNSGASIIWANGVDSTSGWFDAEKDNVNDNDDLLCWAASAANLLSWSGWDAGYANEDDIFNYLESQTHDAGGWQSYAWNFWFDGTASGGHFTTSSHTGYYTTAEYNAAVVKEWDDADLDEAMDIAAGWLQDDYGVGLAVKDSCYHAITLWGIEIDDQGKYSRIWITDSDNDKYGPDPRSNTLDEYSVFFSDADKLWHIDGMCGDAAIIEMEALKQYVPEPSPQLLLGIGLLAFAAFARKRI